MKTGFLQNFDNPIGFLKTLEFLLSSQDKTLLQKLQLRMPKYNYKRTFL